MTIIASSKSNAIHSRVSMSTSPHLNVSDKAQEKMSHCGQHPKQGRQARLLKIQASGLALAFPLTFGFVTPAARLLLFRTFSTSF